MDGIGHVGKRSSPGDRSLSFDSEAMKKDEDGGTDRNRTGRRANIPIEGYALQPAMRHQTWFPLESFQPRIENIGNPPSQATETFDNALKAIANVRDEGAKPILLSRLAGRIVKLPMEDRTERFKEMARLSEKLLGDYQKPMLQSLGAHVFRLPDKDIGSCLDMLLGLATELPHKEDKKDVMRWLKDALEMAPDRVSKARHLRTLKNFEKKNKLNDW
jgi:hypothetical protein